MGALESLALKPCRRFHVTPISSAPSYTIANSEDLTRMVNHVLLSGNGYVAVMSVDLRGFDEDGADQIIEWMRQGLHVHELRLLYGSLEESVRFIRLTGHVKVVRVMGKYHMFTTVSSLLNDGYPPTPL